MQGWANFSLCKIKSHFSTRYTVLVIMLIKVHQIKVKDKIFSTQYVTYLMQRIVCHWWWIKARL